MKLKEELDLEGNDIPLVEQPKKVKLSRKVEKIEKNIQYDYDEVVPNCLRNERIIVRHIPKASNMVSNPKHILYGGMAENATRTFTVPKLSSGIYVNVLTDKEKQFLEETMQLEYNALSIYKKENNFWDDANESGISTVTLHKQDNYLDLSSPEDYIRYKILLANKNLIAPSLEALQNTPKASYQFVIINEGDEIDSAKQKMSTTMRCYAEYGKVENNIDVLSLIVETLDGRTVSPDVKLEFLQTKVNDLILANNKMFLKVITDPLLNTKVLIKKAINNGIISKRGDYLYLRSDNTPLCEQNEEPTLGVAARYLNNPRHLDVKFSIEAKLSV